jgi:hypothetical protein
MRVHAGLFCVNHEPAANDPAAPNTDFVKVLRSIFMTVLLRQRTELIGIRPVILGRREDDLRRARIDELGQVETSDPLRIRLR